MCFLYVTFKLLFFVKCWRNGIFCWYHSTAAAYITGTKSCTVEKTTNGLTNATPTITRTVPKNPEIRDDAGNRCVATSPLMLR